MMTTILISNLIAGTIGGWVTLALVTVGRSPFRVAFSDYFEGKDLLAKK